VGSIVLVSFANTSLRRLKPRRNPWKGY
jgi:hypothetical protein